jgi:hypothetical protein
VCCIDRLNPPVLALRKSCNWTGTANDRFGEINPVSDFAANGLYRGNVDTLGLKWQSPIRLIFHDCQS